MIFVKCRSCGRRYDYARDDCCPGCGAYNRPPKRELVDADGTVRHISDAEFDGRSHAALGKVCFEEKECWEEKECYEYEARPEAMQKRERPAGVKKGGVLAVGLAIAIACVIAAAFNIISSRESEPYYFDYPGIDPSIFEEYDTGADEPFDEGYTDYRYTDLIAVDGSVFRVLDWWREPGVIAVELETEFTDSEHEFYASLECLGENGYLIPLQEFDTAEGEDDTTILRFLTDDDALTPQTFVLEEYDWESEGLVSTMSVSLTGAEP